MKISVPVGQGGPNERIKGAIILLEKAMYKQYCTSVQLLTAVAPHPTQINTIKSKQPVALVDHDASMH